MDFSVFLSIHLFFTYEQGLLYVSLYVNINVFLFYFLFI